MIKYNQLLDACAHNEVQALMGNTHKSEQDAKAMIDQVYSPDFYHHNILLMLLRDVSDHHTEWPPEARAYHYPAWLKNHMETMPTQSYLCDHEVVPFTRACKFRKLSSRASQFIMSLGQPELNVVMDYRKHLLEKGNTTLSVPWNGLIVPVYEEFVAVPINGKYEFFYLVVANGNVFYVHKKAPGRGKNTWKFVSLNSIKRHQDGQTLSYDDEYYKENDEGVSTFFDIEGFLANLWVAETTATCEPLDEPLYTRNEFNSVSKLHGHSPLSPSSAYRYIHITDSVWQKYEHANEQVRSNSNYHVPSWFVRAHYAKRHEKYVLIKGHYAYRKCAGVDYQEPIDYIV